MNRSGEDSYSWVGITAGIILLLVILVTFALPADSCGSGLNSSRYHGRAREAEVKANTHTIQIAVERYYTDHNEYPPYLLGGDTEGWSNWHSTWDGMNDLNLANGGTVSNADVIDPLIDQNYVTSYPYNPFVDNSKEMIKLSSLPESTTEGDGDPRFGFKGNTMGMMLDDPNFFRASDSRTGIWSKVETCRTLDGGKWMEVPDSFKNVDYGIYYLSGGFNDPASPGNKILFFKPGNFFYRASPELATSSQGFTLPYPNSGTDGKYLHYILGAYGGIGTIGMDIIRLESTDPIGNPIAWRIPGKYGITEWVGYGDGSAKSGYAGGLPEVFGGGDASTGPVYPYDQGPGSPSRGKSVSSTTSSFVYGAPDGVQDGVILVLSSQ